MNEKKKELEEQIVELKKDISNLRIKVEQNRGYTTEVKEKQMELEGEIKLNLDLRLTKAIEWIEFNINNKEVLRELNQIVKGIAFDLNKKGSFTAFLYLHYKERLQENEEKLDSKDSSYIHIVSKGKREIEKISETEDSIIVKYDFNEKAIKYPKLKEPTEQEKVLAKKIKGRVERFKLGMTEEEYKKYKKDENWLYQEDSRGEKEGDMLVEAELVKKASLTVLKSDSKLPEPTEFKGKFYYDYCPIDPPKGLGRISKTKHRAEAEKDDRLIEEHANIINIIEEYDNGHEGVFDPKKFSVVKRETEPDSEYKRGFIHGYEDGKKITHRELIEMFQKDWDFLSNKICREYFTILEKEKNPSYISPIFEMIEFYINSRRRKWHRRLKK